MGPYFSITYWELNQRGDLELVETDAYSLIIHDKPDGRRLVQLARDGFFDWIDLDNICDFNVEIKI